MPAYYVCSRAHQGGGCGATRNHRAGALEAEVVGLVDGDLFCDRETLVRWMDAGPGSAGAGTSRRDPEATERALTSALGEVTTERERLVRLYTTGRLGDAEYDAHALALREAEGRANTTPAGGAAEGWERLEHELIRVRNEQTPRPSRPAGRV